MKNLLNAFELVSIKHGIQIELQQNYRLHSAVENETFNLFMKYNEMISNPELFDKWDIETTVSALHNLADFWTNYYLYGEPEAKQKYLEKKRKQAEA